MKKAEQIELLKAMEQHAYRMAKHYKDDETQQQEFWAEAHAFNIARMILTDNDYAKDMAEIFLNKGGEE